MSSLWTPHGEQPIGPNQPGQSSPGSPGSPAGPPGAAYPDEFGGPDGAYDEEIDPEQMREMLARLASTPVEAIVTQFAVQLQELAVLHLGISQEQRESLPQASIAIDALGAIVDSLGERLEPNTAALRQVIAQLRLAYVEIAGGGTLPDPTPGETPRDAGNA